MDTWQQVLLGAIAILAIFWIFPGIKPMMERSKEAEKDWSGLLIPLAVVILFVVFLVATV